MRPQHTTFRRAADLGGLSRRPRAFGRGGAALCAFLLASLAPAAAYAMSVGCVVVLLGEEAAGNKGGLASQAALQSAVAPEGAESHGCPGAASPVISGLRFTPNPRNALSGVLEFETDAAAKPRVEVLDPEGAWTVPASGVLSAAPGRTHRVMILGLRAGTPFTFSASAESILGNPAAIDTTAYTAPEAPADAPPIETAVSDPEALAPGATFFNLTRETGDTLADAAWGKLYAADSAGRVVWSHDAGPLVSDFIRLKNGNLLYLTMNPLTLLSSAIEIDMLGEEAARWTTEGLEAANPGKTVDNLHHEIQELPNGNFLTLTTELRAVGGYPEDVPDCPGGVCNVVGDKIVEFTRAGVIVGEWSLFDVLDPHRRDQDFDLRFWDIVYGKVTKDWTHANAVVYDPRDDTMIVSCRNQDIVFKMTRGATPALVWVLGMPWESSEADDAWPWVIPDFARSLPDSYAPSRQHAPEILANGDLLVYDNGNSRGATSIVRYEINDATRIGAFAWAWEDADYEPRLFAPFVGDVDALPNGNYLQTDGALALDADHEGGRTWSRVVELDPETKTKALELKVRDGRGAGTVGYQIYRAERLSLYP